MKPFGFAYLNKKNTLLIRLPCSIFAKYICIIYGALKIHCGDYGNAGVIQK